MHYDPVKNVFAKFIKSHTILRKLFYGLLNLFFLRSWYIRKILNQLIPEIKSAEPKIFDAGTGFGQYSYFIIKRFPQVKILAVDVKEDYINEAREFFNKLNLKNVNFKIDDLKEINYQNEFDLILCVDVMEHIDDDEKVLRNFYHALKNGGSLIINTPSNYGGSDVHDEKDQSFISEHFRSGYSKEDLSYKLNRAGFENVDGFYTYGFWGDKAWRIGIKYPMMLLNKSLLFLIILPFYYFVMFPFFLLFNFLDTKTKIQTGTGLIVIAKK